MSITVKDHTQQELQISYHGETGLAEGRIECH